MTLEVWVEKKLLKFECSMIGWTENIGIHCHQRHTKQNIAQNLTSFNADVFPFVCPPWTRQVGNYKVSSFGVLPCVLNGSQSTSHKINEKL